MLKKFLNYMMNQNKIIYIILLLSFEVFSLTEPVSTAVNKIRLPDGTSIELVSKLPEKCYLQADDSSEDIYCFPTNKLFILRKGHKFDYTNLVKKWDDFFVYFVKIRKDTYYYDLNGDGLYEIALLPMLSGGGAWYLDAYLYTVNKNSLISYGRGRFNWELGKHVHLGCPKCWKFNIEACNKCY